MRIVTEIIGGILLLLIFAKGVTATIRALQPTEEPQHDDVPDAQQPADAAHSPPAGDVKPH